MAVTPVLDPDAEVTAEKETGSAGPRIRCPLCGWIPTKDDLWVCDCNHYWNTFDTAGVCPACLHQWTTTQCPSCTQWSLHSEWYCTE